MDFYKIPEDKIKVIYNGINQDFFNNGNESPKQNYILYVGRLSPTKNIEGLIKAYKILVNRYKLEINLKFPFSAPYDAD